MEHRVARTADFLQTESQFSMVSVRVEDVNIVIFFDGVEYFALEDRCSHADVKLSRGKYTNGVVTCPAHGARFDVKTGAPLCMPAVTPVRQFLVRVDGEFVIVDLPEEEVSAL